MPDKSRWSSGPNIGDTAWPPVTYEEHSGGLDLYAAAVVPEIAGLDPRVDSRTQALAERATMDMVRFDAELGEDAPVAPPLMKSEAVSSSWIANVTASNREVDLAEQGLTSNPAAFLVAANIRALQFAAEGDRSRFGLTLKSIAVIHYELFKTSHPDTAGMYRRAPGWTGGNSPQNARYVAPHGDRVLSAMNDLLDFMRRDDIPALIQAAVAHAQFVAIYPFTEGNGRVGRAVVSALLRVKGITRNVTAPLSAGLLVGGTGNYFDALGEYREGNIQPVVELFAESSLRATHTARKFVEEVRAFEDSCQDLLGDAPPSARCLIRLLPREPTVTPEMFARHTSVSTAAAFSSIKWMEAAGILVPADKDHGTNVWVAPDMVGAVDRYTNRASGQAQLPEFPRQRGTGLPEPRTDGRPNIGRSREQQAVTAQAHITRHQSQTNTGYTMTRYQIIRLDRSGNGADGTVLGGDLTWEQALRIMADANMDIDYALASLEYKQWYSFVDEDDNLWELRELTAKEGPDDMSEGVVPRTPRT